jgi:hypothetical protein
MKISVNHIYNLRTVSAKKHAELLHFACQDKSASRNSTRLVARSEAAASWIPVCEMISDTTKRMQSAFAVKYSLEIRII